MSLGERIYRLRTEKNLSQGDLAERLEVSRQSVSKWENNNAVPDLEKIITLSEIFEVSLDELVKGKKVTEETGAYIPREQKVENTTTVERDFPPRKIAGIILLCMAFITLLFCTMLGGALSGLVFCLPFLICGILCFVLKKNVGLWCTWTVYFLLDVFMSYATGISRSAVVLTLKWTPEMNYRRLLFAWGLLLVLAGIVLVTVIRLGKKPFAEEEKGQKKLILAWIVLALFQVITMLWGRSEVYMYILNNIFTLGALYRLISIVFSWGKIIMLTVALVVTVRYIRNRKQNK